MGKFEYLSVLTSIVIGLALAQLLSGAARLIQLRRRVRMHPATLVWMATLFLADIQVWWVAFERRDSQDWTFFAYLLYLLIPISLYLLSALILPDLGDEDAVDLRDNFDANRGWIFGLFVVITVTSLVEEGVRDGRIPLDLDAVFRIVLLVAALVSARIRSERFHFWNALGVLALVVGYIATLFVQLE